MTVSPIDLVVGLCKINFTFTPAFLCYKIYDCVELPFSVFCSGQCLWNCMFLSSVSTKGLIEVPQWCVDVIITISGRR